jgi:hypothetical protein
MKTPIVFIFLNLLLIVSSHTGSEEEPTSSSPTPFIFDRSTPVTPWFYERFIKNKTFLRLNGLTLVVDVSHTTQSPSVLTTTSTTTETTTLPTTFQPAMTTAYTTTTTAITTTTTPTTTSATSTSTTTTTISTPTPSATTTCTTTATASTTTTTTWEKTFQDLPLHLSYSAFENRSMKTDQMFDKIVTSLNATQASLQRLSVRLESVSSVASLMLIVIAFSLVFLLLLCCHFKTHF